MFSLNSIAELHPLNNGDNEQEFPAMFRNMVEKRGMNPSLAREKLLHTEPFQNSPNLVAALPDGDETAEETLQ